MISLWLSQKWETQRGKKSLNEPSPQMVLNVGQQTKESTVKPNTIEPRWEEHFRFMIHNPNFQNLEVELKDAKAKKTMGTTLVKLREVLEAEDMVLDQKFPIKSAEPESYVNMRVCLRILTPTANPEWMEDDDLMDDEEEEEDETSTSVDPKKSAAKPAQAAHTGQQQAPATGSSTSPAAGDQGGKAPASEVISPAKAPGQEAAVRQRKSPTVNPAGEHGLGRIQMTFRYTSQRKTLVVVVHKCVNLQPQESDSKNLADPYIKMYLLPDKGSSSKRKTKVIKDNLNPVFDETFEYSVAQEELAHRRLEISIKNEVGVFSSSKSLMGMFVLDLSKLDTGKAVTEWFDLAPEEKAQVVYLE